ncbi:hypothetical protein [Streptomyces sp. NPDC047108]|uniref:hypothetical protein n=1 Tax=Streptomyces sp. NPDC047108 TaxID=3155025 RepID=UPI0033CD5237
MSTFWVDAQALDVAAAGSQMHAWAHLAEFSEFQARAAGAKGAFSTDEDNQKYEETLNQVIASESNIAELFANAIDRIRAVAVNYGAADVSAKDPLDGYIAT